MNCMSLTPSPSWSATCALNTITLAIVRTRASWMRSWISLVDTRYLFSLISRHNEILASARHHKRTAAGAQHKEPPHARSGARAARGLSAALDRGRGDDRRRTDGHDRRDDRQRRAAHD